MEGLESILCKHPFFAGFDAGFCALVSHCAKNVRFEAGQYLFQEGQPADELFLVRHGRVALEIASPARGAITIQTLGEGEIIGIASLIPPYRRTDDARATALTGAISVHATCFREKCEADHALGYEVMKRFIPILVQRLQATRLQFLDVYGAPR